MVQDEANEDEPKVKIHEYSK